MASRLPYAGHLLFLLLRPVFAVGLLAAAWTQERGGKPTVPHLFRGFQANLKALLPLGLVFVLGITAAIFATALFDGGVLMQLFSRDAQPGEAKPDPERTAEELLASGKLQVSMLIAALLALPTVLALWFAPALVVFHDVGPATALGASLRATLANWRPLAVYGIAVVGFGALLPLVVAQLIVLLFPSQATVDIVRIAFLAYGLMFAATLHISDYVSYRDVFHAGETLAPLARG
jgi:uncharacterized membrane protein